MKSNFEKLRDASALIQGVPTSRFCPRLMYWVSDTTDAETDGVISKNTKVLADGAGWLALSHKFGFTIKDLFRAVSPWDVIGRAFDIPIDWTMFLFQQRQQIEDHGAFLLLSDRDILRLRFIHFFNSHFLPINPGYTKGLTFKEVLAVTKYPVIKKTPENFKHSVLIPEEA